MNADSATSNSYAELHNGMWNETDSSTATATLECSIAATAAMTKRLSDILFETTATDGTLTISEGTTAIMTHDISVAGVYHFPFSVPLRLNTASSIIVQLTTSTQGSLSINGYSEGAER